MAFKILQICFRMPWPLKDGGAIAMYNISSGLVKSDCSLTMLVPETKKHEAVFEQLPSFLKEKICFKKAFINSEINIIGAFLNLFSSWPYYISRYRSSKFNKLLSETLENETFDVIIIESLKMSPYLSLIRKLTDTKVFLRSHNVEFLIWERMKTSVKNPLKKLFLTIMIQRLKKYELMIINEFDGILPITAVDADFFKLNGLCKPYKVVLSGIDFERYKFSAYNAEPNSLFHLGALDWLSNIEAIEWFLDNVWPQIYKNFPHLTFYIAGRNTPEYLLNKKIPGVVFCGEVTDAVEFIASKQIMIVPLLSGSGMRIKIAEGMALGKVIISTSVGAEGIACTQMENILIANSPQEFTDAVRLLINRPEMIETISKNAFEFANKNLNNQPIISEMIDFLQKNSS